MKIKKQLLNKLLFITAIGASIFTLFFVITCTWIGFDVKNQCKMAKSEYPSADSGQAPSAGSGQTPSANSVQVQESDCVEALIVLLQDESRGFSARNSAIWALGQLGDHRALPILQGYYTGNIPDREPLDKVISQYELKKAINLAGGGANLTAIFWRYGIN